MCPCCHIFLALFGTVGFPTSAINPSGLGPFFCFSISVDWTQPDFNPFLIFSGEPIPAFTYMRFVTCREMSECFTQNTAEHFHFILGDFWHNIVVNHSAKSDSKWDHLTYKPPNVVHTHPGALWKHCQGSLNFQQKYEWKWTKFYIFPIYAKIFFSSVVNIWILWPIAM